MTQHRALPVSVRVAILLLALFVTGGITLVTGRVAYIQYHEPLPVVMEKSLTLPRTEPTLPQIESIFPRAEAADVLLGAEDPIRVAFTAPVDQYYIDFRFDPPLSVTYEANPDRTEFKILPSAGVEPGKVYDLAVFARLNAAAQGADRFLTRTRFTTRALPPEEWSTDKTARVADAKRYTKARMTTGKYIDINLSVQILTIFEEGRALDSFLISSGRRGMDTPKGEYAIHNKARRPWSKQYSLYMPYWMALTDDGKYGIHELPEWPGGYKEGVNHLGIPVSHGCVRLGVGPAERVWNWAEVGTPVVIY